MGQGNHLAADFPEVAVKPFLELLERDVGGEAIVEAGEGQLKLGSELSQRKCRDACLLEGVVGGLEDARQVVHKRARPIKDDVPNHARASYLRSGREVRKRLTQENNCGQGVAGGTTGPCRQKRKPISFCS